MRITRKFDNYIALLTPKIEHYKHNIIKILYIDRLDIIYDLIKVHTEKLYLCNSTLEQRGSEDGITLSYTHSTEHIEHNGLLTHLKHSCLNQCRSSTKNRSLAINSVSNCEEASFVTLFNLVDLQMQDRKLKKRKIYCKKDQTQI